MTKKSLLLAVVLTLVTASLSFADPVPPSKGQWAYPLEQYLQLHKRADENSPGREISMPQKWINVPSATRDKNNFLWYKVNVDGQSGWLPQNGIRLKMGGKSKSASNIYKHYAKARRRVMDRPRNWSERNEGGITTYTTDGGIIRVFSGENGTEDLYFRTDRFDICSKMLGVDLIDMSQPEVRAKLGTPTIRETPYGEPDLNILSYELPDRNMTLAVIERRYEGDTEGTVISVELYRGRPGERDD
ncbi:MAG: hypothetical protein IJ697_07445 [Synergistaceae bacterium]|nr:hypothetical protein [Synergistaceae bacterium]